MCIRFLNLRHALQGILVMGRYWIMLSESASSWFYYMSTVVGMYQIYLWTVCGVSEITYRTERVCVHLCVGELCSMTELKAIIIEQMDLMHVIILSWQSHVC